MMLPGYDGWKLEAPPAADDYVAICESCGGEIEPEEDVWVGQDGKMYCSICWMEGE